MYESGENYLETILMLQEEKGTIRSIDIAKKLGFSKPSVSRAIKLLKEADYIEIQGSGEIHFTVLGLEKAKSIYERHKLITEFLVRTLEIHRDVAEMNACKIEHVISDEVLIGIKHYLGVT